MKKMMIAAVSSAALFIALPAMAQTVVNVNLTGTNVAQNAAAPVAQTSRSASLAIGSATNSAIESTALSALNLASIDFTVDQNSDFGNLNAQVLEVAQLANSTVNQTAESLAGSGALGNSSLTSLAAAIANNTNVTVGVTQR
ncbi:MAG: hypothetical protein V4644_02385 [Patescibacteria group bacterium]